MGGKYTSAKIAKEIMKRISSVRETQKDEKKKIDE
jgi:hypothetical protein